MARQKFEFMCTECRKYFDFMLNTSLNGNYRIHCPNCEHIHFRTIENGAITEARFSTSDHSVLVEDIRPMKSSCRDYQEETAEDNSQDRKGFLSRLWKEVVQTV